MCVREDQAINNHEFTTFLNSIASEFGPIPSRRRQKNVLESKHGIIRSIYIRLKSDQPDADLPLLAQQLNG